MCLSAALLVLALLLWQRFSLFSKPPFPRHFTRGRDVSSLIVLSDNGMNKPAARMKIQCKKIVPLK
jgi:hypothetical protein